MTQRIANTAILLSAHTDSVNCIAVCPYNKDLVVTGGDDKTLYLWNIHDLLFSKNSSSSISSSTCTTSSFSDSSSTINTNTINNSTEELSSNRLKPITSIVTEDSITALTFCNSHYAGSLKNSSTTGSDIIENDEKRNTTTLKSTNTKSSHQRKHNSKGKAKKKGSINYSNNQGNHKLYNFDSDNDNEENNQFSEATNNTNITTSLSNLSLDENIPEHSHSSLPTIKRTLIGTIYAGVGIRILEYRLYQIESSITNCSNLLSHSTTSSITYTFEPGQRLQHNTDEISALVMHHNEGILASSDDDGNISLIQTETNTLLRTLRKGGHTSICSSVAFRANNTSSNNKENIIELVSGGFDHNLICWNGSRGIPRSIVSVASTITLMMYSPESIPTSDVSNDNKHKNTKSSSNHKSKTSTAPSPFPTDSVNPANIAAAQSGKFLNPPFVHTVIFSPCNQYVICSLGDGTISVCEWDTDGSNLVPLKPLWWKSEAHKSAVTCLCFIEYPNNLRNTLESYLVSAGNDGWIQAWKWNNILNSIKNRRIRTPEESPQVPATDDNESIDSTNAKPIEPYISFPEVPLAFRFRHGRGPNYMTSINPIIANDTTINSILTASGILLVADTRKDIYTYNYDTIFTLSKQKSIKASTISVSSINDNTGTTTVNE